MNDIKDRKGCPQAFLRHAAAIGPDQLFLAGYMLLLLRALLMASMFPKPWAANWGILFLGAACIAAKIFIFDSFDQRELLFFGLICGVCLASFVHGRYSEMVIWPLTALGARGVDFRRILRVHLAFCFFFIVLMVSSAMCGAIENLQYVRLSTGDTRNAFGSSYPTDFAGLICFLFVVWFYLLGEGFRFFHALLAFSAGAFLLVFCHTRLDAGCLFLLGAFFGINHFFEGIKSGFYDLRAFWQKLWSLFSPWAMPVLAAVILLIAWCYESGDESIDALNDLNDLISSRLYLGHLGFVRFGVTLFGQVVDMVGFGGSTVQPDNYFFIDCSYEAVLLQYGLLPLCMLLALIVWYLKKNSDDIYLLMAWAIVAVNCVIAHHMLNIAYCPFVFLLWAKKDAKHEHFDDMHQSAVPHDSRLPYPDIQ